MLGVFARFSSNRLEDATAKALRSERDEQFKEYLWGADRKGGLSQILKPLHSRLYGEDVQTILLQFNVNPVKGWPQPKEIENYRPTEKSIAVWISIGDEFFHSNDESRRRYVKNAILDRLHTLKKRFAARKFDTDMDKLIKDVEALLAQQ